MNPALPFFPYHSFLTILSLPFFPYHSFLTILLYYFLLTCHSCFEKDAESERTNSYQVNSSSRASMEGEVDAYQSTVYSVIY